jgi:hypothetical protein
MIEKPKYQTPTIRELTEDEVLEAFQLTAGEISSAACWWAPCGTTCP